MPKMYSVNVQDDQIVSYEVDGIPYESIDDVPDEADRAKLRLLSGPAPEAAGSLPAEADDDEFTPDDFSIFETDPFFKEGFDKEFDQGSEDMAANPPRWNLSKILLGLFAAISVLMLGIAAYSAYRVASSITAEVTTEGWVVDMIERKNSDGNVFYYPVVEFYLPDNRLIHTPISEGSWPPAYMKGEAVTIAYNPEQPLEARIDTGAIITRLEWTLPLVAGILGVAFAGGTALAWWIIKDSPPDNLPGKTSPGVSRSDAAPQNPGAPRGKSSRKPRKPAPSGRP